MVVKCAVIFGESNNAMVMGVLMRDRGRGFGRELAFEFLNVLVALLA